MIDPKKHAAIDQIAAQHLEVLPPFLKKMYDAFVLGGFTEYQALELTKIYLQATIAENKAAPPTS
jgi:hypothetical protein